MTHNNHSLTEFPGSVPELDTLFLRGAPQERLHERARTAASHVFGRKVFVRAVVEVSNFCRQDCLYCGMRRSNRQLDRYRLRLEQLSDLLLNHCPDSVTDINLQAGEDPVAAREIVLPLVKLLNQETDLGVSVCLGNLDIRFCDQLRDAGASIYIIKFETGDRDHYAEMQSPGAFDERIEQIKKLARSGWKVSSGFIAGLPGQTNDRLLSNFTLAASLPLAGCSVSPFVPGDETPLCDSPHGGIELTLNCMAALRLMRPSWVIPAVSALNIADPGAGYGRGLRTGANLVTINLTPEDVRGDYLLYKRERFIMTEERILRAILQAGLEASTQSLSDFYASQSKAAARAPAGLAAHPGAAL